MVRRASWRRAWGLRKAWGGAGGAGWAFPGGRKVGAEEQSGGSESVWPRGAGGDGRQGRFSLESEET